MPLTAEKTDAGSVVITLDGGLGFKVTEAQLSESDPADLIVRVVTVINRLNECVRKLRENPSIGPQLGL